MPVSWWQLGVAAGAAALKGSLDGCDPGGEAEGCALKGMSGGSCDFPTGRSLVGSWVGGSGESRVVAAGAASAFAGWPGRPVERSPDRAQRDPVPGPHRCPMA